MATATQQSIGGMPHGLGLLTTVASLPPKYRSRYLNIKTKCEIPLDLSVKPLSPQIANDVPIATAFAEVYTEPSSPSVEPARQAPPSYAEHSSRAAAMGRTSWPARAIDAANNNNNNSSNSNSNKPITPPLTPKRKWGEAAAAAAAAVAAAAAAAAVKEEEEATAEHQTAAALDALANPAKMAKTAEHSTIKRECTPTKPIRSSDAAPRTAKAQPPTSSKAGRHKATRKLKFDEETSSPVSGTIIRPLEEITAADGTVQYSNGDIDPRYNIVEITEETKAELAAIKNVIGDYVCRLCRLKFEDAFGLARHRCACIVLLEYRCPECGKQFNCPANLASHRRWHKPKKAEATATAAKKENRNTTNSLPTTTAAAGGKLEELEHACGDCGKLFKRQAYLRKHQLTHAKEKKAKTLPATAVQTLALSYAGSSSASSVHSYGGGSGSGSADSTAEPDSTAVYSTSAASHGDYEPDSLSDCSSNSSSAGYGRLQIVENGLTEEENIAAAALTNLRNCASVIQHTTLAH